MQKSNPAKTAIKKLSTKIKTLAAKLKDMRSELKNLKTVNEKSHAKIKKAKIVKVKKKSRGRFPKK